MGIARQPPPTHDQNEEKIDNSLMNCMTGTDRYTVNYIENISLRPWGEGGVTPNLLNLLHLLFLKVLPSS